MPPLDASQWFGEHMRGKQKPYVPPKKKGKGKGKLKKIADRLKVEGKKD